MYITLETESLCNCDDSVDYHTEPEVEALFFFLFFLDSISLPDARGGIAFLFLQHTGSNVNDFVCVGRCMLAV